MKWTSLFAAGILLSALIIFWPKNNQTTPIGTTQSSEDTIPMVEVVMPSNLSDQARAGETAFNENCAACHGVNAAGNDGKGPPLIHIIYEPNHHGDAAFQMAAARGVPAHHWRFGDMPAQPQVSPEEITLITRYIREVQEANGIR